MKVAHLCMIDRNGAGTAALRIHKALLATGIDSTMYVLNTIQNSPDVCLFENSPANVRIHFQQHSQVTESIAWPMVNQLWHQTRGQYAADPSLELFSTANSMVAPDNFEVLNDADIIFLHWVSGVVNFHSLPEILKEKPIVWRFSDLSPFTGGCHYSRGCIAFHDKCGSCPQLNSRQDQDISRLGWLMKRNAYASMNITCVAPSRWIQGHAKQSSLLGNTNIHHIPNCVPLNIYTPGSSQGLKKRLGINPDHKVLLFGAASLQNPRKGLSYILEALNQLYALGEQQFSLVSFGSAQIDTSKMPPYPWHILPHLDSDSAVAEALRLADVFLLTPEEENFPSIALESLAVGTPVVGFETGGIPEIVQDSLSGLLGPTGDVTSLVANIRRLLNMDATEVATMKRNCRKRAESFSEQRCAYNYSKLFKKIIDNSQPDKHSQASGINILSYEGVGSWILGKFAQKLHNHLSELGISSTISSNSQQRYLVTHHIPYLGWEAADNSFIRTLMITHVDTQEKVRMLMRQLAIADMGICMSHDTVKKLIHAGLPAEKLCFVHPAQDGEVHRRKIRIGITSRLYSDARKRENMLVEALTPFDSHIFSIKIMGSGWEQQVATLRKKNFEVEYIPDFDKDRYLCFFESIDYYLYLGMDEGSMGYLDALHAGVKTIVTAQGFHIEAQNAPTFSFTSLDDLKIIFEKIASDSNGCRGDIDDWTWERYAKQHAIIWRYIADCKNPALQFDIQKALHDTDIPNRQARQLYASGNRKIDVILASVEALSNKYPILTEHLLRSALVKNPTDKKLLHLYEEKIQSFF